MHDALPSPRRTRAKVVARCIRGKSGAGRGAYSDFGTRSVRRAPGRAGGRGTAPSAPPPAAPPCSSSRTYRGRRPSPTCAPRHSASAACCDHGHAPARRARAWADQTGCEIIHRFSAVQIRYGCASLARRSRPLVPSVPPAPDRRSERGSSPAHHFTLLASVRYPPSVEACVTSSPMRAQSAGQPIKRRPNWETTRTSKNCLCGLAAAITAAPPPRASGSPHGH